MFKDLNLTLGIFQFFLTILMLISINSFSSVKKGYVTLDQLLSTTNLGYNLFYRILSPVVFISIVTIALYALGLPQLTKDVWLISIYYFGYNFIVLLVTKKFELVNKLLYFTIVVSSILLSYWIYVTTLQYGLSNILPDSGGLRTEFWLIIIIYFYSLLNNFTPDYSVENERKKRFLLKRYSGLNKNYFRLLSPTFKNDKFLKTIFFSIMITEDVNRPPIFRLFERLLFFTGMIKTTGIMQVTSNKMLTDKESIILAEKIILNSYKKHFNTHDSDLWIASKIASDYNAAGYGSEISQNYGVLKSII
jgi:hypothetical protein